MGYIDLYYNALMLECNMQIFEKKNNMALKWAGTTQLMPPRNEVLVPGFDRSCVPEAHSILYPCKLFSKNVYYPYLIYRSIIHTPCIIVSNPIQPACQLPTTSYQGVASSQCQEHCLALFRAFVQRLC